MSCVQALPTVRKMLTAYDGNAFWEPYTEWIPCTGLEKTRVVMFIRRKKSSFRAQLAYQFATVRTDKPLAHGVVGAAYTTNGEKYIETSSWATMTPDNSTNQFWIRFGVRYQGTSTGARGQAEVGLDVTLMRLGDVVGSRADFEARVYSTVTQYEPVTEWLPAVGITKAMAALITNSTGSFSAGLVYRTATKDPLQPNGWQTVQLLNTDGNTEKVIPEPLNNLNLSGMAWVQFGLGYKSTSGADGQANVSIAIAARGN